MNIRKMVLLTVMATVWVVLGGCLFNRQEFHPVQHYDLKISSQQAIPDTLLRFRLSGANDISKYKMIYRDSKCRILVDDYNKWVQPPEFMTARHLQGIFSRVDGNIADARYDYNFEGNIFLFVADVKQQNVFFGIAYKIYRVLAGERKIVYEESVVITEPVKEVTPETYAVAMTAAVDKFAVRLRNVVASCNQKQDAAVKDQRK